MAPFAYVSPKLGRLVVESGFDTDYASVPRAFWNLFPPDGPWSPAAWIHDMMYWYHGYPVLDSAGDIVLDATTGEPVIVPAEREQADNVLLDGMTDLGLPWATRQAFFRAVRTFGGGPWDRAERQRLGIEPPPPSPVPSRPAIRHRK